MESGRAECYTATMCGTGFHYNVLQGCPPELAGCLHKEFTMNRWAIGRRGASLLVAALLLAVSYMLVTAYTTWGYGFNAQPSPAPQASQLAQALSPAEFRMRLFQYFDDLSAVVVSAPDPYIPDREVKLASLAAARASIASLPDSSLATFQSVLSAYPSFWDVPTTLQDAFDALSFGPDLMVVYPSSSSASAWLATQSCPTWTDALVITLYGLKSAYIDTRFIYENLDESVTVIVLGEGSSVPNPFKIAASVVSALEETAILDLELIKEQFSKCAADRAENFLQNFAEQRRVHLQVIELEQRTKFLVLSTMAGKPVPINLVSVHVIDDQDLKKTPHTYKDVTAGTTLTAESGVTGIFMLTISEDAVISPPKYMRKVDIYRIEVNHDEGSGVVHQGTVVFDRDHTDNLAVSQ
ncbi:MAG: hypothetical protein HY681_00900 [Chloroflexi bacterium]|nr:hypothetical protein [Chloroflexota bacterium]